MATDPLQESTLTRVAKFGTVTLAVVCIAAAAFAFSAYLSDELNLRIPISSLWLSILLCVAGLTLSGVALRGRGSWKEVAGLMLPTLVAAAVAFRFGMLGVFLAFFLGYLAYLVLRRLRSGQWTKADEI